MTLTPEQSRLAAEIVWQHGPSLSVQELYDLRDALDAGDFSILDREPGLRRALEKQASSLTR
jgi:hypothetical protein